MKRHTSGSETLPVSRRTFIGTTAAGGAALLAGGLGAFLQPSAALAQKGDGVFIEKTIPELQAMLASGQLTSRELVLAYLQRIAGLNPLLHAVIETNPRPPRPGRGSTMRWRAMVSTRSLRRN